MAIRDATPLTIRPAGVCDSIDASNSSAGVMAALQNLVPALHTERVWVARPAAEQFAAFAGFNSAAQVECIFIQGSRCFGLVASSRFAGRSEPFIFDRLTNAYITIQGVSTFNCPVSQSTQGDWVPPQMALFGGRIITTHIGFAGIGGIPSPVPQPVVGWFDMTGFLDATGKTGVLVTGSYRITGLSANVLQAGWRPGQLIQDNAGIIPAGTRIAAVSLDGLTVTLDTALGASPGGAFILTVAGGSRTQPLWSAGNINGFPLASAPVAVAQFAGSAFYAIANGVAFSDPNDPLSVTNAFGVQALTFQDGGNVTAMAGLPLNSLQGGIVQSIMCFQGAVQIQQISGTFPTSLISPSFVVNKLNVATGTLAPATIAITSNGMAFIAPDGMRIIDFQANVSTPIGAYGRGISLPFRFAVNPTRMCAAFNGDVYRVSLTTPIIGGAVLAATVQSQEFWYHFTTGQWSGPHTFPANVIAADQTSLGFIMAGLNINAKLWKSDTLPGPNSTYTENGALLTWVALTTMLPDNSAQAMNAMVETMIALSIKPNDAAVVQFNDDFGNILDSVNISAFPFTGAVWGQFNWGAALWGGVQARYVQYQINWHIPLVFKQGQILITGSAGPGVALGNLYLRTERLGYQFQGGIPLPVAPIVPPVQGALLLNRGGNVLLNQGGVILLN